MSRRKRLGVAELARIYPSGDCLPLHPTRATYEDVEELEKKSHLGDTLFLFLARELCSPRERLTLLQQIRRVESAIDDLTKVRDQLQLVEQRLEVL